MWVRVRECCVHTGFSFTSEARDYVGVGKVVESVKPVGEFEVEINGTTAPILSAPDLKAPNMGHDLNDADKREYLVRIEWEKTHPRDEAFWELGLFANQNSQPSCETPTRSSGPRSTSS